MKILRMTLTLLLLLVPLHVFAADFGIARLSLVKGEVQVRIADSDEWLPAAANTPIYEGDSVWSPKGGRAEIQLSDGSVIRLDGKTALNLLKVESDYLQFSLEMGRAYIRTSADRDWSLQFDLPESTFRVNDRGRYRLEIRRNDLGLGGLSRQLDFVFDDGARIDFGSNRSHGPGRRIAGERGRDKRHRGKRRERKSIYV